MKNLHVDDYFEYLIGLNIPVNYNEIEGERNYI